MITAIIVWGSVLFAGVICVIYLLNPNWRKQIEQPKYQFHQQAQDFDKQITQQRSHS